MNRIAMTALAATMALAVAAPARAGAIFFAGTLDEGKFVADDKVKGPCFSVRYSTTTVEIDGTRARTTTEETVVGHVGHAGRAEGASGYVCVIPLAGDATVVRRVTFDPEFARAADYRRLSADDAAALYEQIASETRSVGIVALSGRPALVIEVPGSFLRDRSRVTVEHDDTVRVVDGIHTYMCPMPAVGLAREPVARMTLTATVWNALPIRAAFSPTHDTEIERSGPHRATARVSADNVSATSDYELHYVADRDPLGLRLIAHRGDGDEDGYFMLVGNPTGVEGEGAVEKDVLFVLDTSGSMRGEKIEQARSAVEYCLEHLARRDRFNIIAFGTDVESFREGPVEASKRTLKEALEFVDDVVARGRTNISGALAKGLAGRAEPGRPRIMIFLTDGTPTAGELIPEKIVEGLADANKAGTQIFVMGVGHDVNAHLLDRLAEETDGSSDYVDIDEDIDVKVAALYDRLSHPVLTNVKIDFGDLWTSSVYPQRIGALFRGTELTVSGRYRDGGEHTVTVSGEFAGRRVEYACRAVFPGKEHKPNEYVASLWAARTIGFLLQQIRLHGENKELVSEVVRLSREFGIVTEYTAFIASSGGKVSAAKALEEARRRMSTANGEKAGQWAFNQARNDGNLQARMVASQGANTYIDRQGKVQRAKNIRQIGRRVFYQRDGEWVEAEDAGERKKRTVKLFSREYFELVRDNADFARAQSVGEPVTINVGGERIRVKK